MAVDLQVELDVRREVVMTERATSVSVSCFVSASSFLLCEETVNHE